MSILMLEAQPGCLHIQTITQLRTFMQHHVYAVWDFTLLLKALQQQLVDAGQPHALNLIDQLVREEECDWLPEQHGGPCQLSHFEIYLLAMEEIGAETQTIRRVIRQAEQQGMASVLSHPAIPAPARRFIATSLALITSGKVHQLAAAFCYGRERLVPVLFRHLRDQLAMANLQAPLLAWYLDRHITLDGDQHGPLAEQMVLDLCAAEAQTVAEVVAVRELVEQDRALFWREIGQAVNVVDGLVGVP